MTPTQYGAAFVRFWWLVLIMTGLGFGAMVIRDGNVSPDYTSTARVAVVATPITAETPADKYQASLREIQASSLARTRMEFYADFKDDPGLLTRLQDAGIGADASTIRDHIRVEVIGATTVLGVTATDPDATRAHQLAGDVAKALADLITQSEAERRGETLLRANVVGATTTPLADAAPRWRNPLIGAAAGLALGLALAVLLLRLDPRVRDHRGLEELLGAPVLGSVPFKPSGRRASSGTGNQPIDEVRTQLFFLRPQHSSALRIAVTGPRPYRGDVGLVVGLAASLAETGARVLLIDADLRDGVDHVPGGSVLPDEGLSGVLTSGRTVTLPSPRPGAVDVLAAGAARTNADNLLHGTAFEALLAEAADRYDYVVIRTAPLDGGTGALAVSARADATLLALRSRGTTKGEVTGARAELANVGATVAGAVLMS